MLHLARNLLILRSPADANLPLHLLASVWRHGCSIRFVWVFFRWLISAFSLAASHINLARWMNVFVVTDGAQTPPTRPPPHPHPLDSRAESNSDYGQVYILDSLVPLQTFTKGCLKSLSVNRRGRMYSRPVDATPTGRPSRRNVQYPTLLGYLDWVLSCFSSVVRQMPGYKWKGARPAYILSWRPSAEVTPPPKAFSPNSGFNPPDIHPTKGRLLVGIIPHQC
jgi:hypothetical protein